jgi:hypothetical protein
MPVNELRPLARRYLATAAALNLPYEIAVLLVAGLLKRRGLPISEANLSALID